MADIEQESGDNQEILATDAENESEFHENTNGVKIDGDETGQEKSDLKERAGSRRPNRFQPYSKDKVGDKKGSHRNRVFISNIPYDMKWQAIKDLMRQKVGEVTYVELFKDAEGKSRGYGVVEFKDEEFVKKAIEVMNRYDLNGRPLNIKEDPDGEHARRMLQRAVGMYPGGCGPEGLRSGMNFPPSIINNPNVPPEIIHSLQAGRLGSTVFVANLDFKVGWKKLKEVFSMAGVVKRADVKEEKNGKSRGMGTVTFEEAFEAVQAVSMFNGQMLFDRPMLVKMDDKSLPLDDFHSVEKTPQLPRGLGGVGMGLGPGGQPISTSQLSSGGAMGSMGRGAGMDGPGYGGMNRMGGMSGGGFNSMDGMGGFGGRDMAMGRMGGMDDYRGGPGMGGMGLRGGMGSNMGNSMGDMYPSGMGSMNRDFGRNDMPMNRGYGDSFGGMGMGNYGGGMGSTSGGPMGSGMGGVMGNMGMDRMGSNFDRVGMDANRGFGGFGGGSGQMGGGNLDRGSRSKVGCQIFVRNLPYDLTWQKLKEKFSHCGQVMFAEIKMENGRSKGCGTVRFDSPESAEQACRLMNGIKINGREVDVRLDRNA
ncbi:myelin expression factor 2-like isoform X2 [Scleropages formosus]|uniref:myelin expression factor 2-like isoform X2 n=1 Tax=Scleropages formosus TaxID=113540 RepID=UPI0008785B94|nr:myelin expression factor 2-like isoform X2 [Scleropages formosus]